MKIINFKDFTIIPVLSSLKRVDMSDEEYFSKQFASYVSNSRLKLINPAEGGTPESYRNPPHFTTQSLVVGSAVHERVLQPDDFELAPKLHKPSAKLGACVDAIIKYRKEGESIYDSIVKASQEANYYASSLTKSRIRDIIKKGLPYYLAQKELKGNEIVLSDNDYDTVVACINSLEGNKEIMDTLHPTDSWGDPVESYNEDAMFIDYVVVYQGRAVTIKYKMKIDNWTIDPEAKRLVLNDLKTTYKPAGMFMNSNYGSMFHYHYYRQFALYGDVLQLYCMKERGFNLNDWNFSANVLVVSTSGDHDSKRYAISPYLLKKGRREYRELLKRVAYYEMFGYDEEVKFK